MQNLQLSIPEPCHENWEQMTPTKQGRFCNACAKEVIDFSSMTDIQVLNYFTNLTHEKVCGRALPEQLDRIISRPEQPKKRLFWYWNYIVLFFMFFAKGNSAKAQSCTKPATELTPVKNLDIRGEMTTIGGVKRDVSRVVTGKVTDKDANPVSFASIKIKGTTTGVSADANGAYTLKVNSKTILNISAAGFKVTEIPTGMQATLNTVLEKDSNSRLEGEIVFAVGGMSFRNSDDYYPPEDRFNNVAVLTVQDETSGEAIPQASIVITKNSISESFLTDKKGIYKLKGIKKYEAYFIKVIADGYEPNEFTISTSDFKDRKKELEILLRKQKVEVKIPLAGKLGEQTRVRVGGVQALVLNKEPLYVVDGNIQLKKLDINPDYIVDITVLEGPAAAALFGPYGANGAILITTKKFKVKSLDTVTVTAYSVQGAMRKVSATSSTTVMGATIKGALIKTSVADTLKLLANKITGAVKIYPNPVQRGQQFNLALKLKQAGLYQMQITDATGRVVLQKQINAISKEHIEKIVADSRWSSGAYYVSITDSKNKLISNTSFILE